MRSLKLFEDGAEIEPGRAQLECSGTQSCSAAREYEIPTLSRSVGSHIVTVVAEDTVGHKATREIPYVIERDNRPPRLSVANLAANGILGAHPQDIAASATDEDRGVTSLALRIDGATVEAVHQACPKGGCALEHSFAPDLSDLASGQHTFAVRAEDGQGNVETFTAIELVDNSAPLVSLSGPLAESADAPLKAKVAALTIASKDPRPGSGVASVDIELDEAEVSGYPMRCTGKCGNFKANYRYLAQSAGPGEHTVSVEVGDRAGNRTSRTIAVNVPSQAEGTPACSAEAEEVPTAGVISGPQATQQLEEALPQALAASKPGPGGAINPSLRADGEGFEAVESLADTKISAAPDGGVKLNRIACLTPGETTSAATNAEVVNEDAAIYADTGPASDTVIRPTADGVMMVRDLRGPEAGASYTWNITVNEDEKIIRLPSGAIAIVEPVGGGVGAAGEPPRVPNDIEEPKALASVQVQRNVGEYEIAKAQAETSASIVAVIAQPWILLADDSGIPAVIRVAPVLLEPNEFIVTVHMPADELAAAVYPAQVIATASISTATGSCHSESPCGVPDLGQAAHYAEYWGNPNHGAEGRQARNPYYWDYTANNCTNFISQIIHAGGQKFMLNLQKTEEAWWYKRVPPWNEGYGVNYGYGVNSNSWSVANLLPRHLWQYELATIDTVQEPYGWTRGDILAEDWFGTDGIGNFDHMQFVVGTETPTGKPREPLISNESSPGHNYSQLPWRRVRENIQQAEPDGWERVALVWRHTIANADEKKHTPANLYGPGGLFHG